MKNVLICNSKGGVPQSELFVQASAYSKSIVEYAPKSKVALATIELCNKVREYINIQLE